MKEEIVKQICNTIAELPEIKIKDFDYSIITNDADIISANFNLSNGNFTKLENALLLLHDVINSVK